MKPTEPSPYLIELLKRVHSMREARSDQPDMFPEFDQCALDGLVAESIEQLFSAEFNRK